MAFDLEDEDWELFYIADTSDKKRIARSCNHIIHETGELSMVVNSFEELEIE